METSEADDTSLPDRQRFPYDEWVRRETYSTLGFPCRKHFVYIVGIMKDGAPIYGCLECGVRYERREV